MRKLYYAIFVLLLVGLNSCGEDEEPTRYNSNDFVGVWITVNTFAEIDFSKDSIDLFIQDDTISLNSDGTASINSTVNKYDGTFVNYIRTESGTWNYAVDSNYLNVEIKTQKVDQEGNVENGYFYNIQGNITQLITYHLVIKIKDDTINLFKVE